MNSFITLKYLGLVEVNITDNVAQYSLRINRHKKRK